MTIQIELPDEIAQLLDPTGSNLDARVREALVLELFREGAISAGKAAELLGISQDAFRELHQRHGIPYFRQTIEEVLSDAEVLASARPDRPR